MSFDDEPPLEDMIYLNFPELSQEKLVEQLQFYMLKWEVKCEE